MKDRIADGDSLPIAFEYSADFIIVGSVKNIFMEISGEG